jgi:hypothetical protein
VLDIWPIVTPQEARELEYQTLISINNVKFCSLQGGMKNFKATIITIPNEIKQIMLIIKENIRNLGREI